jgi:HK97 family phage portal protein
MWPFSKPDIEQVCRRRWNVSVDELILIDRKFGVTAEQKTFLTTQAAPQLVKNILIPPKLTPQAQAGKPIRKDWSTDKAVQEGFKSSSWVYACVSLRARAVASVPFIVQEWNEDIGQWEVVTDHPLADMIASPNPNQNWEDFLEIMVTHMDLGGNAIDKITLGRGSDNGTPLKIILDPLQPDRITPVPSKELGVLIDHYDYKIDGSGQPREFKPDEILHFRYVDPAVPYWGMSPLQAGSRVVDLDVEALNWNVSSMSKRAVPDGVLSIKDDIDEDQFLVIKEWAKNHFGSEHGIGVIGNDAEFMATSLSPVDMDFNEGRRLNREEICALYGIPPPLVAILDRATYSNVTEMRLIFWQDTIIPLLSNIANLFNYSLVNRFWDNTRIWYDLSSNPVTIQIRSKKIEDISKLTGSGVPFNVAARFMGLDIEEISGGDVGYLPANLLPVTSAIDASVGPAGTRPEDEEEME